MKPAKETTVDSDDEADDQEEDDSPEVPVMDVSQFKLILVPARDLPPRPLDYPYTESKVILKNLASTVFNHGDERTKTRAILYLIFHHALHDRFYDARDLLLMSHLQDNIHNVDVPTQIIFNRYVVSTSLRRQRARSLTTLASSPSLTSTPQQSAGADRFVCLPCGLDCRRTPQPLGHLLGR